MSITITMYQEDVIKEGYPRTVTFGDEKALFVELCLNFQRRGGNGLIATSNMSQSQYAAWAISDLMSMAEELLRFCSDPEKLELLEPGEPDPRD